LSYQVLQGIAMWPDSPFRHVSGEVCDPLLKTRSAVFLTQSVLDSFLSWTVVKTTDRPVIDK